MLVNVNLVLVSDVRFVERKGYLTMVIEGAGVGRYYFRRTEAMRQWGQLIKVFLSGVQGNLLPSSASTQSQLLLR